MKTRLSITSIALPLVVTLAIGRLAAPTANAREISAPMIEIEAKFVETSRANTKELGFEWICDFATSVSPQLIQPRGSSPMAIGTFPVNPPANMPATGDIRVWLSTDILKGSQDAALGGEPRVTTRSAQRAAGRGKHPAGRGGKPEGGTEGFE